MNPRKARRIPSDLPRRPRRGGRGGTRGVVPPGQHRTSPAAGKVSPGSEDEAPVRLGPPQTQEWPDGDWVVRQVPGAAAGKLYRCPGCDQEIRPGTAHVVVWPAQTPGLTERRHWHIACWQRRPRRPGPGSYR